MGKEVAQVEEDYAYFRHQQDEYHNAYFRLQKAMNWHCKGIRTLYHGARFDCERQRVEEQNQFFARRKAAECLIGEETPYDVMEDSDDFLEKLSGLGHIKVHGHMALPPEVAALA